MLPHLEPETLQEFLKLFNRKAHGATEKKDDSETNHFVDLLKKLSCLIRGK